MVGFGEFHRRASDAVFARRFRWVFPENPRTPRKRASVIFAPGLILIPSAVFGLLWHKVGFQTVFLY